MKKPRFNSLAKALAYIADEALRRETKVWQTMLQADIDCGGGWDE